VKQLAIDMGYDIRDCSDEPECLIGWGFWGKTDNDAWNALESFRNESGIMYMTASLIENFEGGYLYVIKSFYASGLYNATERWKVVSEPYWSEDGKWVVIDYEMKNPDLTECPEYPTGYCYYYRGEPWIGGECKNEGGGQMYPGHLTGRVLFAGNPGDVVTLKLAKIDRRNVSVVESYPDEVTRTIPEKPTPTPVPAFIDITKVEISTDGGTTWMEISEGGTVYAEEGTIPQYRVTVKNTGDAASDVTYVGLYDCGEGGEETPYLEAFNSNYDFQLDPGAETTLILDYGRCTPQPTLCPVERDHVYKIISVHAKNVEDDVFTFTITEPTPVPTMDKDTYFTRLREKCTNSVIDMDSMPAVFGYTNDNQDKWCNPPQTGRFAGWWSSKEYKDKKVIISIVIDWPYYNLGEDVCGNPPKSKECISFEDWDGTVEWDEIPSEIAEESLEALPIKPIEITCDNNPYGSLGLKTGCELLLYYDKDRDGVISDDELTDAYNDWVDGKITEAEFNYVGYEGYLAGSINNLCPGCYKGKKVTFVAKDKSGTEVESVKLYIDGELKG